MSQTTRAADEVAQTGLQVEVDMQELDAGSWDAGAFNQAEEGEAFKQVDQEEDVPPFHRIGQLLHGVEGLRHRNCAGQLQLSRLQLSRARPG